MGGRIGALGYALLGLLAREPRSGYDLARWMKVPIGFFWQARHSQIYPELAGLEARGLVVHHRVEQQDRPDKKVYEITTAGRDELGRWVTAPPAPRPVRNQLLLKAYCLWLADRPAVIALFRDQERRQFERLADYERRQVWMEREWGDDLRRVSSPHFATYATLRAGIGYATEAAAWCRWVAEQLEQAEDANSEIRAEA